MASTWEKCPNFGLDPEITCGANFKDVSGSLAAFKAVTVIMRLQIYKGGYFSIVVHKIQLFFIFG